MKKKLISIILAIAMMATVAVAFAGCDIFNLPEGDPISDCVTETYTLAVLGGNVIFDNQQHMNHWVGDCIDIPTTRELSEGQSVFVVLWSSFPPAYVFNGWFEGNTLIERESSFYFTMPNRAVTLRPVWTRTCNITDCFPYICTCSKTEEFNPYGAGEGDIAIFGAKKVGVDFWRAEGLDDIANFNIWHQQSDRGEWIEYSIIWISERTALVEFANRVKSPEFLGVLGTWWDTAIDEMLEAYSEFFFANSNLVLVSMVEGVLTTGIRRTGVCVSGAVDITRTIFDDSEAITLGIPLTIGFPVSNRFVPTNMTINATTNIISRADTVVSTNRFVNIGAECICNDWQSRPIEVWVVLDTHLHLWVPFANSQDALNNSLNIGSTHAEVDEVMRIHRENSQRFHTENNTTFFNEIGLTFDSEKYTITMSCFSPFNIVTFYTVEAFNEFIEMMTTVIRSSVAQGISIARACNNPKKWGDGGNRG